MLAHQAELFPFRGHVSWLTSSILTLVVAFTAILASDRVLQWVVHNIGLHHCVTSLTKESQHYSCALSTGFPLHCSCTCPQALHYSCAGQQALHYSCSCLHSFHSTVAVPCPQALHYSCAGLQAFHCSCALSTGSALQLFWSTGSPLQLCWSTGLLL